MSVYPKRLGLINALLASRPEASPRPLALSSLSRGQRVRVTLTTTGPLVEAQ